MVRVVKVDEGGEVEGQQPHGNRAVDQPSLDTWSVLRAPSGARAMTKLDDEKSREV